MSWKRVRLELSRSEEFPRGSTGRAMIMHIPVGEEGFIDREELCGAPGAGSVRRYWGSEPDQAGHIKYRAGCLSLDFRGGVGCSEILHLDQVPIRLHQTILIKDAAGRTTEFRVVAVHDVGIGSASHG